MRVDGFAAREVQAHLPVLAGVAEAVDAGDGGDDDGDGDGGKGDGNDGNGDGKGGSGSSKASGKAPLA